jgi:hypothetical protein
MLQRCNAGWLRIRKETNELFEIDLVRTDRPAGHSFLPANRPLILDGNTYYVQPRFPFLFNSSSKKISTNTVVTLVLLHEVP